MKARIVPILTLLWCLHFSPLFSQTPKYIIGPSEYNCYIIPTATHHVYDVAGGMPTLIPGQPAVVTAVEGSLHHGCLLDDAGNCYCWGNNVNGQIGNGQTSTINSPMYKVAVDSLGNPFNNIVQIMPGGSSYGYSTAALKGDGTVWIWGATGGGNRGNGYFGGTNTRPVQINFPAGVVIKKIQIDVLGMALDANGNVWTWGANAGYAAPYLLAQGTYTPDATRPKMISLPGKAVDITGGNLWNYALLADGRLYGWGFYTGYLGIGNTGFKSEPAAQVVPQLLNAQLGLPLPIRQIKVSSAATYVILTDSTLWAWGDNACGAIGNGVELDYSKYTTNPSPYGGTPKPYNWDWGPGELLQQKPVHIANGLHSFTDIWTSGADTYYCYAEDVHGQLYSWGRNKGAVLGNGVVGTDLGALAAMYPNSWDVPWVTAVDPFGLTKTAAASSPWCVLNPTASTCNVAINRIQVSAPPTVSAGPNQNITTNTTTLQGSATGNNATIISYLWTQVSGPNTPLIIINTGKVAQLTGLVSGTYVFQLKATDNNWRSGTSQVTIVVNAAGNKPPKAATKGKVTITLPTNSATLDGSPSTAPSGTISSYAWTQVSGPSTAGITSPSSAVTTVTGLVQGTYAFFLTVTDNLGATGTVYDTVVVNPGANTPPTVSAGSSQTVQLPVSSATLTGTATGNGGATISTTSWIQVSGPNTAVIKSASSLSTSVTGLIAGTYTFQLTAKDNNGLTSTSTVTVTVSAAANVAPTVTAGSSQSIQLPTSSVTLTGTATGNGGATISTTSWTQTGGPNTALIKSASTLSTSVIGLVAGTYTFQLSATDNKGLTSTSTVTVTVNAAANVAPTVTAGNNQTIQLPANSVTLTGTAVPNGGASLVWTTWTQWSGPNTATIGTAGNLTTSVSGLVAGVYVFKLTARDNNGLGTTASVSVIVNAATKVAPTVSVASSTQTIQLPTSSVTLTGTATGNGGATIATTSWTQTSGPNTAALSSASSLSTGVSGLVAGTYAFQLTATDNNGLSDAATVTVTVNAAVANVAPTVTVSNDQTIQLPTSSVTLTGTATANGGASLVWTTWTQWSGPNTATIGTAGNLTTSVSGLVAGVYIFKLTARDNNGLGTTAQVTITVTAATPPPPPVTPPPPPANKPPVANAGSNVTIQLPVSNVNLDGSASYDPDGTIAGHSWIQTAGPGGCTITNANTATPTIYVQSAGQYTFQLTVTDNQGATGTSTVTITVLAASVTPPASQPPIANAGRDTTITLPNTATLLNGTASTDPSGSTLSYKWDELSGPTTATIAYPNAASTPVGNLMTGTYVFRLTVTNAAGLTAQCTVTVRLIDALRSGSTHSNIQILPYPNPVQGILHIRFTGDAVAGPAQINLYDMKATLQSTQQVQISSSGQEVTIDMSRLARGVYALQIVMGGASVSYQMIVKQ